MVEAGGNLASREGKEESLKNEAARCRDVVVAGSREAARAHGELPLEATSAGAEATWQHRTPRPTTGARISQDTTKIPLGYLHYSL